MQFMKGKNDAMIKQTSATICYCMFMDISAALTEKSKTKEAAPYY